MEISVLIYKHEDKQTVAWVDVVALSLLMLTLEEEYLIVAKTCSRYESLITTFFTNCWAFYSFCWSQLKPIKNIRTFVFG